MKHLVVIAQKVNTEDDLLGFFIEWLREFSKKFDQVSVICLEKGNYDLPDNVKIYSVGKEKGHSKIKQALKFFWLLAKLIPDSEGVFVHMSPIFAIAAWPFASLCEKKVVLWYLHRSVTWKVLLADKLCSAIVTADKESLRFKSDKVLEIGHGIKMSGADQPKIWNSKPEIISVGRISRIKNFEIVLEAVEILNKKGQALNLDIIGRPITPADFDYKKELEKLPGQAHFTGMIPYDQISEYYKKSDLVVNAAPDGGLDKVVLEGMAAGCLVLTSNHIFAKYFGEYKDLLTFAYRDPEILAQKIQALISLDLETKNKISEFLKNEARGHSVASVVNKISRLF